MKNNRAKSYEYLSFWTASLIVTSFPIFVFVSSIFSDDFYADESLISFIVIVPLSLLSLTSLFISHHFINNPSLSGRIFSLILLALPLMLYISICLFGNAIYRKSLWVILFFSILGAIVHFIQGCLMFYFLGFTSNYENITSVFKD